MELNHRYQLTAPHHIRKEGIQAIRTLLRQQTGQDWLLPLTYLPPLPQELEFVWVTDGGKFTTRVARFYKLQHQIKLPASLLSAIGNLARAHSQGGETYHFEFVDRIDWRDGDFGDSGSCYWHSSNTARQMLEENDARAMCFFDADDNGMARAWLWDNHFYWLLWNGYGFHGNATLTIAMVFAQFTGLAYRKIALRNNGTASGNLYINSASGYAIGAPDAVAKLTQFDFHWDELLACYSCGRPLSEYEAYYSPDGESYCDYCFYQHFDRCNDCGESFYVDDLQVACDAMVCERCLGRYYDYCDRCQEHYRGRECPDCPAKK